MSTEFSQQHVGSTASTSVVGVLNGSPTGAAPQPQLPPAEPPLTRAQLDARFERVEREARARRREAVEDARLRRQLEPAGTVKRRLVFD